MKLMELLGLSAAAAHCRALCLCCLAKTLGFCRSCAWWEKPGMPGRRCERCGAFQRLRAHHCAACERCVDTHDHHCLWLGTCIGARNQAMCAPPQGSPATSDDTAGSCILEHTKTLRAKKIIISRCLMSKVSAVVQADCLAG